MSTTGKTGEQLALERYYRRKAEQQYKQETTAQLQPATTEEETNKGGILGGIGYGLEKLGLGALRSIEGIGDYIVGGVADLFGADEFADDVMKNDWVNYNHADEWYNPSGAMGFVGDVAGGVGGMLPSIALTAATGGLGAPAALAQGLGTGAFMLGAAGQSVSDASKESGTASGKEWGYGTLSGAAEGAVEAISGGLGGTQFGKVLGKNVAKSTAGKLATTFVGEGLEEVASDLIDPALKRMTGVDESATVDWSQLPNTFLVGGATGAVLGGAGRVANAAKVGGFNNLNAVENAQEYTERTADNNLRQAQGKREIYSTKDTDSLKARLSDNLVKMDETTRARFLAQNPKIAPYFETDGRIKNVSSDVSAHNASAYSASLKGREDALAYKPVSSAGEVGEKASQTMKNIELITGGKTDVVLTNDVIETGDGRAANGAYVDGVLYINANASAESKIGFVASHELVHTLEGTDAYARLADFADELISADPKLREKYGVEKYLARYAGAQDGRYSAETRVYEAQTELIADFIADEILTNPDTIRRLTAKNEGIVRRILTWLQTKIRQLRIKGAAREELNVLLKAERLFSSALRDNVGGISLNRVEEVVQREKAKADGLVNADKKPRPAAKEAATARYNIQRKVFEIGKDSELAERIRDSNESKYKTIQNYLVEKFGGYEFTLSDGKRAIMDKSDAKELAHKADERRTAELSDLKGLVENAEYLTTNREMTHNKFDAFSYYLISVDYQGDVFDLVINVGEGKFGIGNHIYAITNYNAEKYNKKKDAHNREGLSGSADNPITKRASFDNSISETTEKVNRFDEKSPKRFSLEIDGEEITGKIEETKDLVALHNLSAKNMLKVLELGGFPMPSIAVTKPELAHDDFGEITVVFGRETIDPKSSSKNKVFSRDAWTPTVPTVEYKANEKVEERLHKKYYELARKFNYDDVRPLYKYVTDIEGELDSNSGESGMLSEIYGNTEIMQIYLLDTQGEKVAPVYKEHTIVMPEDDVIRSKALAEALGDSLKEIEPPFFGSKLKDYIDLHREDMVEALAKAYAEEWGEPGNAKKIEEGRRYITEKKKDVDFKKYISVARRYVMNGTTTKQTEYDGEATKKEILERVNRDDYRKWVNSLFAGIQEKVGIRNDVDPFTRSGNRRSFEATHYDYTLDNIVKVMSSGTQVGGGFIHSLSLGQLSAKLAKEFKSVEEIKQSSDSLKKTDDEAKEAFSETSRKMLNEITDEMVDEKQYHDTVDYWSALDSASVIVGEIAEKKLFTLQRIASFMAKEYPFYNYNDSVGRKILGLFEYVKQMTATDYFEAKPRRAVSFDEIKEVLLPKSADEELISALKDKGIKYTFYEGFEKGERSEIIKKLDNVRFSLNEVKQYTQEEAKQTIDDAMEIFGALSGATERYDMRLNGRNKIAEELASAVNSKGGRLAKAKKIVDLIVDNISLTEKTNADVYEAKSVVSALRPYFHSMDLSTIKSEIERPSDLRLWGSKDGGAWDSVLMEILEKYPQFADERDGGGNVDVSNLLNVFDAYRKAATALSRPKAELSQAVGNLAEIKDYMEKQIANSLSELGAEYEKKRVPKYMSEKAFEESLDRPKQESTENAKIADTKRVTQESEKPTKKEKLEKAKAYGKQANVSAQINFTNAQAGIERAAKRLGVKDMEAKTHKARVAKGAAENMIALRQFDYSGENAVGKSLREIFEPVHNRGDEYTAEFYEFLLHMHNIDRMSLENRAKTKIRRLVAGDAELSKFVRQTNISEKERVERLKKTENGKAYLALREVRDKPVFGDSVTANESEKRTKELRIKHPDFQKYAEEVWKYNDNLLQYRLDAGLITQAQADVMRDMYRHYVPTFRDTEGKLGTGALGGKYNLEVKKTIKSAKGSDLDILDLSLIMGKQTIAVTRAAAVNDVARTLYDAAQNTGDFSDIEILETKEQTNADGEVNYSAEKPLNNEVSFYKDGKRITMRVTPEVFAGFEAYSGEVKIDTPAINILRKTVSTFKKLVTEWNPLFLLRNFARDFQEAAFYTKNGVGKFIKNLPDSVKMMKSNDVMWQRYQALGGVSNSVFDYETGVYDHDGKTKKGIKKALGLLASANSFIEQLPRFNEFVLSVKRGESYEQALLDSADVTTNFTRGGKITKVLNSTLVPFLNPSVQGFSKLWRTATGRKSARAWGSLIVRALILGIGAAALNDLLNGDDEEYESLSLRDKENYYLFKIGDLFLKIPKGRVLAAIGSVYLRMKEYASGNENAFDGWMSSVASMVTPVDNVSRTIFAPFSDVVNNRTWYGTEIEGQKFENVAPSERYDESTSSIAVALGKVFNYSPKKIHYLIAQYSGVIGDVILPLTTNKAERDMISANFTIDPVLSNSYSDDFYTALEEAQYAKSAGDPVATLKVRYLNGVSGELSDMYQQKRDIANSDLSDKEKQTQTRVVQALINETLKNAVERADEFEQILIDGGYEKAAEKLVSDKAFQTLSSDRQTSAAQKLSDYYYTKATVKLTGETAAPKYYLYDALGGEVAALHLTVIADIAGDTDKSGNTVSGSRKQKVHAYIEKQKLSALQKYILLTLAGYSPTETGKSLIAAYLKKAGVDEETIETLW